jgi:hypothetical protein
MKIIITAILLLAFVNARAQSIATEEYKDEVMDAYLFSMLELTKLNATIFYPGLKDNQNHLVGFFPMKDGKNYKCLYWRADPAPEIYATVSLNDMAELSSAKLDTTVRQFTKEEAGLFRISDAAFLDYVLTVDTSTVPKKSYLNVIPLVTKLGKRVYINHMADGSDRLLFGYEVIYNFDKEDSIVSRVKPHKVGSEIRLTGTADISPKYGKWFHSDEHENIHDLQIADLATVLLYHRHLRGQQFVFKDRRFVYVMEMGPNPAVFIHTHASYDQIYLKNNIY